MNTSNLKVLGIIPARIGSTRVPQKMLKDICGKPLIQRTWERSANAKALDALVIATDSNEVERVSVGFGAKVIRSIAAHNNGTERAAEAVTRFTEFVPDIVAILWGDGPLYPASVIDQSIALLVGNPSFDAVVPSFRIDPASADDPSVGKVVADMNGRILYLSRAAIPFNFKDAAVDYYSASGALIMRRELLAVYGSLPRMGLEAIEDVEQLRLLERGYAIGTVKVDFFNREVNTPEDYEAVVQIYRERDA